MSQDNEPGPPFPRDPGGGGGLPPPPPPGTGLPGEGGLPPPPPPAAPPAYQRPTFQHPGEPTFGPYTLASWGSRAAALLVDGLITQIPLWVGVGLIVADQRGAGGLLILAGLVGAFLYYPLTMMRPGERNGQTIGKQTLDIRVIREDGQPLNFGTALVREFVIKGLLFGFVGAFFLYIPILLDYLWPLWDEGNRALHDMVASTRVVCA